METTVLYMGDMYDLGIMEKRTETTLLYIGFYTGYIGIMERKWKLMWSVGIL